MNQCSKRCIWMIVPKSETIKHCEEQGKNGKNIDMEQIMMVWSFKRKRHPDGSLDGYKARLCCHLGGGGRNSGE